MSLDVRPLIPHPVLQIMCGSDRILILADLHIGWEESLLEKGIHIPSQAWRIRDKLSKIIEANEPDRIIFLGDIKDNIPMISLEEERSVKELFAYVIKDVGSVSVTLGNHDGDLDALMPHSVDIISARGLVVGKKSSVGLFHGHAWPSLEVLNSNLLVMAHIHPFVWLRDKLGIWIVRRVWIKATCDRYKLASAYLKKHLKIRTKGCPLDILKERTGIELNDPRLIIMPVFNDLIGGVSITRLNRHLIGPFMGSGCVNLPNAEVYMLDGTFLGTVKHIRTHMNTGDNDAEG